MAVPFLTSLSYLFIQRVYGRVRMLCVAQACWADRRTQRSSYNGRVISCMPYMCGNISAANVGDMTRCCVRQKERRGMAVLYAGCCIAMAARRPYWHSAIPNSTHLLSIFSYLSYMCCWLINGSGSTYHDFPAAYVSIVPSRHDAVPAFLIMLLAFSFARRARKRKGRPVYKMGLDRITWCILQPCGRHPSSVNSACVPLLRS